MRDSDPGAWICVIACALIVYFIGLLSGYAFKDHSVPLGLLAEAQQLCINNKEISVLSIDSMNFSVICGNGAYFERSLSTISVKN